MPANSPHNKWALVILSSILPGTLMVSGCDDAEICSSSPAQIQLSTSGRAVAFIDPQLFSSIITWFDLGPDRPNTSFDCILDTFTEHFDNDVDIMLAVLDIDRTEFLERSLRKVISNFTVSQRIIESGIGTISRPLVGAVGPPSLRSYSLLGIREGLLAGPSLHELAHGWCAYLDGPPALAAQIDTEPLNHWGYSSVGGVLGGWQDGTLEQLSEERYRACSPSVFETLSPQGYANNNIPYAPLELYLMGLIPPHEVPDIQVALNPVMDETQDHCMTFYADGIETITIEDIISVNGARLPSVEGAQKHFRVGLIIIAESGLSSGEWLEYEQAIECLETTQECQQLVTGISKEGLSTPFAPLPFFQATGRRASLQFVLIDPRNSDEVVDENGYLVLAGTLQLAE